MPLSELGHCVTGVEINQEVVDFNRSKSLNCINPVELKTGAENNFDVVLMSYVIEHFYPDALIKFMDEHLDLLKKNGRFIIATPLFSDYFYDNFDHVKPYHPLGGLYP